ncbi:MAG: flagellar motor protein MotA [Alteromonadaceae bacterium]|nr:MAG: flagellar motor protein MotA [Alteromonadaceae bacterium]
MKNILNYKTVKSRLCHAALSACILIAPVFSQAQTTQAEVANLDDLLAKVIAGQNSDTQTHQQRLREFERAKTQQESLFRQSQATTQSLEQDSEQLNLSIAERDQNIATLETRLTERLGNFGELFGVTRQVASDTRGQINNSIISAQFPGREKALDEIAQSKTLPTLEQLRNLWVVLLQEQTEQGKVARFTTTIAGSKGFSEEREVVRIGSFNTVSEGQYLIYDSEVKQLKPLARQPGSRYTNTIPPLTNPDSAAQNKFVEISIDPSSGTILSLLVQAPNLLERFHQGGLPGYVVTVLAVIGISIGLVRLLILWITSLRVSRQIHSDKIKKNNPLGRVLQTYQDNPNLDVETLELKLDDAILKELPKLDQGLNLLKVLAAVAPLIGLLGTVVGMILTFQAITLWGTGEPKIMAGGISQALVTTVQGLIAAIPLLLLHSLANSRARVVQQVLEEQSAGLIAARAERAHG